MQNFNSNHTENNQAKVWAGLIIIIVGVLLLVENIGLNLPSYIFHWSNILIVIGLLIGAKHQFRDGKGLILILIGSFFTMREIADEYFDINFNRFGWPVLIIAIGLYLLLNPNLNFRNQRKNKKVGEDNSVNAKDQFSEENQPGSQENKFDLDYLDSVNVFGGSNQVVFSKNFKGGQITAVFGGCDVNLTQADFVGEIVIDVTAVFGGAKIIVPSGWILKQEVTAVFGGVEDKRVMKAPEGGEKYVLIKGLAMFGGVEIKSY